MYHCKTTRYTKTLHRSKPLWVVFLLVLQGGCQKKCPPIGFPCKDTTGEHLEYTSVTREASRPTKKESNNEQETACGITRHEQPLNNQTVPTACTLPQESESMPTHLAAVGFMQEDLDNATYRMRLQMNNTEGDGENIQQPYDNQTDVSQPTPTEDMGFVTQLEASFNTDPIVGTLRQESEPISTLPEAMWITQEDLDNIDHNMNLQMNNTEDANAKEEDEENTQQLYDDNQIDVSRQPVPTEDIAFVTQLEEGLKEYLRQIEQGLNAL